MLCRDLVLYKYGQTITRKGGTLNAFYQYFSENNRNSTKSIRHTEPNRYALGSKAHMLLLCHSNRDRLTPMTTIHLRSPESNGTAS